MKRLADQTNSWRLCRLRIVDAKRSPPEVGESIKIIFFGGMYGEKNTLRGESVFLQAKPAKTRGSKRSFLSKNQRFFDKYNSGAA